MAEAYTSMGRMGSRIPLRAVRFVTNDRGNLVASGEVEAVQVFPARDVYLVVHIMEGVVNRGTGARSRAQGFRRSAAGKTGTTNDKRDAWFAGFTPDTLALTWLGFDDNKPTGLSGSDGAVPIWARYMAAITAGQADREFPVPSGVVFAEIDTSSGGLSTENCPRNLIVNEAFKAGTEPHGICPLHGYPMMAGTMYPYGIPPGTTTDMYPPGMPPMDPLPPLPPITIPPVSTSTTPSSTQPAPQPTRNDPPLQGGVFRTETSEPAAPSPEIRREGEPPPTATLPPTTTSERTTTNPE
jgi:penicillin-binding protein 1B